MVLLGTFGYFWALLGSFPSSQYWFFWVLLGTFGYFWELLGSFGNFWVLLGTFGHFGVLFRARSVGSFGYFWALLLARSVGSIWLQLGLHVCFSLINRSFSNIVSIWKTSSRNLRVVRVGVSLRNSNTHAQNTL